MTTTQNNLIAPPAQALSTHAPSALTESPRPRGGSFKDALEQRLPLVLARTAADPGTDPLLRSGRRLIEAAGVVRELGMPHRHQAARMALTTAAGAYDWFFRQPSWELAEASAPDASLTWQLPSGDLVVDLCSCDPLASASGPGFTGRAAAVWGWAEKSKAPLVLVRLLPLTAPTSALGMTSPRVKRPLDEAIAAVGALTGPARVRRAALVAS